MNRAEYEKKATEFRASLLAESKKPMDEQQWPDIEGWLSTPGTSTCTTPTCRAFDQPCPVVLHENADGIYRGQCGVCQQPTKTTPVWDGE